MHSDSDRLEGFSEPKHLPTPEELVEEERLFALYGETIHKVSLDAQNRPVVKVMKMPTTEEFLAYREKFLAGLEEMRREVGLVGIKQKRETQGQKRRRQEKARRKQAQQSQRRNRK